MSRSGILKMYKMKSLLSYINLKYIFQEKRMKWREILGFPKNLKNLEVWVKDGIQT